LARSEEIDITLEKPNVNYGGIKWVAAVDRDRTTYFNGNGK
jgi:hypothetical protein